MWIYTKNGFFSIVEDRDNPDKLLVRARIKGDIEKLWPTAKVSYNEGSDYAYRASINRGTVSRALGEEAKDIDYDNFKERVNFEDKERAYWYSRVWTIMTCMQAVFQLGEDKNGFSKR